MEIAISESFDYFVTISEREDRGRAVAGFEFFALVALFRVDRDPLDVVLVKHRMRGGANCNGNNLAIYANDRNMFLGSRVGRVRYEFSHGISTAGNGTSIVAHERDDIATVLTNVKLHWDHPFLM